MIVFNRERFFFGGRCGVIHNQSFRSALITDSISAVVLTFSGEWDGKNYNPVAEALLCKLSRQQVRKIHDVFLDELDQCGADGLDLGGAIEQVFGRARHKNIVSRYQNNAGMLLAAGAYAFAKPRATIADSAGP